MRALLFVLAGCATLPASAPCERAEPTSYRTSALTRAHVFLVLRQRELPPVYNWTAHVADVDGDGQLDCWATYVDNRTTVLLAWPSCTGDGEQLEYAHRASRLEIPAALASPAWLQRIAKDLGDADAVACTTKLAAYCVAVGPEWLWVLGATYHKESPHELLGAGELHWRPFGAGIDTVTHALITIEHDRVVLALDPARDRYVEEIACAGLTVGAYKGGVFARDLVHRRWTWLLRGLPALAGFTPSYLECQAGLVIAHARYRGGETVRIDPETGIWAYESL